MASDQARLTIDKIPAMTDMISMKGKTAIVSGGTYGLGYNVAYRYAEAGANVIVTGRGKEKGEQCVADFKGLGYEITYLQGDCTDLKFCEEVVAYAEKTFGKVDILANIAGKQDLMCFLDMQEEVYDKMMDINVKGTYFMSQAVARSMVRNGVEGYIVNCSSTSPFGKDFTLGMLSHYAASKGAVNALTLSMGRELAQHNIHVNAVACGSMKTTGQDICTPEVIERYGDRMECAGDKFPPMPDPVSETPDDMARVFFVLSTPLARFMLGNSIHVDGGSYLCSTVPTVTMSHFYHDIFGDYDD